MRRSILSVVGIGALAAGLVSCCSTRKPLTTTSARPTPCDHLPHSNVILIQNKQVSCDDAYVSKNNQDTVEWIAPGHRLEIKFTPTNPFEHLICGGDACSAFSAWVEPSDKPYKYEVLLDGERVLDPNVIIKP